MKQKFLILSLFIFAFLSSGLNVVKAQLLLEENFEYVEGTNLTDNGWKAHSGTSNPVTVTSSGLSYDGYATDIGKAASVSNNGQDVNKTFSDSIKSGDIYASFLMQTSTTNSEGYFIHFGQRTIGNTKFFTKVWVNSSGDKVGLGSSKPADWFAITPNQPNLIVIKYNYDSKTSSLFVINGAIPTVEPVANATFTESLTLTDVGSIALRQYNISQNIIVDAIRVAKTWAELFPVADTFAPEITISPDSGAVDVPITTNIKISFNEPILDKTGTEILDPKPLITFKLDNESGADVNFTATINTGKDTITITPDAFLSNSQVYYIELDSVKDAAGNATDIFKSTFTTVALDVTPPVATIYPDSGAVDVPVNVVITIKFDEPVLDKTGADITDANLNSIITLKKDSITGADVNFTATINAEKDSIRITPQTLLLNDQVYYIKLDSVSDASGNVADTIIASFTTIIAGDFTPPVATIYPSNGAVDVPVDTFITIAFNEPVRNTDATDITDPKLLITFKLDNASGLDVAFDATINTDKDTITVTPSAELAKNQKYYLKLDIVEDTAGNEMLEAKESYFKTEVGDTVRPKALNAWAESLSSIKVAFSEPLDNVSATNTSNYTGIDGISAATLNTSEDTVTLSLSTELVSGVKDTIIIQNIADKALNVMAEAQKFEILYVVEEILISSWHFDTLKAAPNTQLVIPADSGIQKNVAAIYADGTNGSSTFVTTTSGNEITAYSGTSLNDERVTPANTMALAIVNQTANGKGIVVKFSMAGYKDAELSFVTRGAGTGFKNHYYEYSTNGTDFIPFDTIPAVTSSAWALETVNLAEIADINNASDVYIRIKFDGATSSSGNNRLDNVTIKANKFIVDATPPEIAISPDSGAVDVPINTNIKISFNEPIFDKTGTEILDPKPLITFKLDNASGDDVNFTATINDGKDTITVTPSADLLNNQVYYLELDTVKDAAGNATNVFTSTFTTIAAGDVTAPVATNAFLTSLSIANVTFDEAVDPTTAEDAANYTGLGDIASVEMDGTDKVILTLVNPLVNAQTYTLTVGGISDLAGNVMTTTYQFDLKLDTTIGINNHAIGLIEMYPNPANNYFIIDNIENASMINVYNSIGKAVINKDCRELNRVEIDATILESGLYYVSIYYNDGQVVSKPISIVK